MNTIRRFSGLAVFLSVVFGFAAVNTAAQNVNTTAQNACDADGISTLDAKIRTNYSNLETLRITLEAAKQYLQKYGGCETTKDFSTWLKQNLTKWEQDVKMREAREKVKKFDLAVKGKNFDEVYTVGKELVALYPDNVHFMLPLGLIGLSESYKRNFKYNDDTIKYAKMARAKLTSGTAESKKDKDGKPLLDAGGKTLFGPYQFERNAEDAVSELTYALAYILYHAKQDKRAGLLYYYEVSQLPGPYKLEPRLYATIGNYYVEESAPIGKDIIALIEKQKLIAANEEKEKLEAETKLKLAATVEEKQKLLAGLKQTLAAAYREKENLEAEIKPKVALYNGYTERALDAFSRAYKFADEKIASEKILKAGAYTALQGLFERRFAKKDGLDKWVADAAVKPFPNPTSEVTPVADPEPAAVDKSAPIKGKPAPVKKP